MIESVMAEMTKGEWVIHELLFIHVSDEKFSKKTGKLILWINRNKTAGKIVGSARSQCFDIFMELLMDL